MSGSCLRLVFLCLLHLLTGTALTQALQDAALEQGGRDLSVVLFSAITVHSFAITPLGPGAWRAACAACTRTSITTPFQFYGPGELFLGGTLRIADPEGKTERTAAGLWHLRSSGIAVEAVLTLPSERYVAAVLNAEASADEPAESLRALAVVARTYALNGIHFQSAAGSLQAGLCDSTECQAMRLGPVSAAIDEAVRVTAGETLWFGGRRAAAYFSQNCGGITEDAGAVWPAAAAALPYLRAHPDPFCLRRAAPAWHAQIRLSDLEAIARAQGWRLPASVRSARVVKRSRSHRALLVAFESETNESAVVGAGSLRFAINRVLGWNQVRSDGYELAVRNGMLLFDGRGYGHGVGLCQAGAAEMALEHKTAREILAFYFPSAVVRIGPRDGGWQSFRQGDLVFRSAGAMTPERGSEINQLWHRAMRLFPPAHPLTPEITFAPSTELFRQFTAQPGWMLASTSGLRIVLQPTPVLAGRENNTLLHEMLHVLVEAEAIPTAPLWLREGLVEELSDPEAAAVFPPSAAPQTPAQTPAMLDAELLHPSTPSVNRQAHLAAVARVRAMQARYGDRVVRGWLTSALPPGVR